MMRPKHTSRARRAAMALGALSTIAAIAVLPAAAQTGRLGAPAPAATPMAAASVATAIAPGARHLDVVAGSKARVKGHVIPAQVGRPVTLQRRAGDHWRTIDSAKTDGSGRFAISLHPRRVGTAKVRLRAGAAKRAIGRMNVYRHALVSWYGPGLYGNHLGCGGTLEPGTLGVAHKTLPCGTKLTLRHGSHHVRVRVVDRGPYVGGREFDLTAATRDRLRFNGVGTILVNR